LLLKSRRQLVESPRRSAVNANIVDFFIHVCAQAHNRPCGRHAPAGQVAVFAGQQAIGLARHHLVALANGMSGDSKARYIAAAKAKVRQELNLYECIEEQFWCPLELKPLTVVQGVSPAHEAAYPACSAARRATSRDGVGTNWKAVVDAYQAAVA